MNVILLLLICLTIFIIFYMKHKYVETDIDTRILEKSILSKSECEELIQIAKSMILKQK